MYIIRKILKLDCLPFSVELYQFLMFLDINSLSHRYIFCKYQFHFVNGLLLLYDILQLGAIPLFFFFSLLLPWFLIPNSKIITKSNAKKLIVSIFFKEFYTFRSYVQAFFYFELILCIVKNRAPVSLSCTCLSSFTNTIY